MGLAIIDADMVMFRSCPPRRKMISEDTQLVKLGPDGKRLPVEFTPEEEMEYLQEAWDNFVVNLEELKEKVWEDEYIAAVGGCRNFRQDLFPEYKLTAARNPNMANKAVPKMRERAINEGLVVNAVGYEADDLVRIWAEQARANDIDFVICTGDKDLFCIHGMHYYLDFNKEKNRFIEITEEDAMVHYYRQLIEGDSTDNIPGVPGIGPKTVVKMITPGMTEAEMQEVVLDAYCSKVGGDWLQYFLFNAKLIHILRTPDDYFDGKDWPLIKDFL